MKKRLFAFLLCVLMLTASLPIAVFADTTISGVNIIANWNDDCTKIATYSTSTPGCTVTNVEYSINRVAIDKVAPGDNVSIAFTVSLGSGYSFASSPKATWNGLDSVAYVKTGGAMRFVFELAVPTPITSVDVTVNAPKAGANTGIATPARADQVSTSCFWYEDGKEMDLGKPFRSGHVYKVEVHAFANGGYAFNSSTAMKINGNACADKTVKNSGEIVATYTFPKLDETKKYTLTTKVEGGNGSVSGSVTLNAGETTTVIFTPDADYEIDKVTVNGSEVGVLGNVLDVTLNENKTLIVTYKKFTAATPITSVTITGVTAPVAGQIPNEDYTLVADGVKQEWGSWFNHTDGCWTLEGETLFEAGKIYIFYAYVSTAEGYAWPKNVSDVSATINGEAAGLNVDDINYYDYQRVFLEFTCSENSITSMTISGVKTVEPGRSMKEAFEVPEGCHYRVENYYWGTPGDTVFEAGKEYSLHIRIKADTGYSLSGVALESVLLKDVTGKSMDLKNSPGYVSNGDYYYLISGPYLAEAAPEDNPVTEPVTDPVTNPVTNPTIVPDTPDTKPADTGKSQEKDKNPLIVILWVLIALVAVVVVLWVLLFLKNKKNKQ